MLRTAIFIIFFVSVLQTEAQIEIFDDRAEPPPKKISKQEKLLIEKFVFRNKEWITKFANSVDFHCEKDFFSIDSVAQGFFTNKKQLQKAYLYQLCFFGQSQYATYLGGIVIVEHNQPSHHFVFADIHGYNNIKTLPDLNRNGYSEIALEFYHSISGYQFVKAVRIFDPSPQRLTELASLDVFTRLTENDIAYRIYVKKGVKPIFYRETYESEYQENKWLLIEKKQKFKIDSPPDSSENIKMLPIS